MSSFGERFKEIRLKYNLTQAQIGKILGISDVYVSQIENQDKFPSDTLIYLFCLIFHIRKEWLINGEYPVQENPQKVADQFICFSDINFIREVAYHLYSKFLEPAAMPQEVIAIKEGMKRDKDLSMIIDYLETLWANGDRDMQGWLKVQFRKAFPDFEDFQKKRLGIKDENAATGA